MTRRQRLTNACLLDSVEGARVFAVFLGFLADFCTN
jgi:hypothetical protein